MLYYPDIPEDYREEFDDLSIHCIGNLARLHADEIEPRLGSIDESELPQCIKDAGEISHVADALFDEFISCIRYGAREQENYMEDHFRKMFRSCYNEGS